MQTIDEIRIEEEDNGFHLVIFTDDGERLTFRVGLPDQIKSEVDRTIGAWLKEGEKARRDGRLEYADVQAKYEDLALGYDKSDPHHPMWHENASGIYDNREGK